MRGVFSRSPDSLGFIQPKREELEFRAEPGSVLDIECSAKLERDFMIFEKVFFS
jgi:hypothetical protein